MAEAKCLMSGELQQLLECSICYNTFTNPLCLPCMHTFCCNCIKEYVHNLQSDWGKASEFNCPTCRCRVVIPEGGVGQLPKHLFVENLKDAIASSKICNQSEELCPHHEEESLRFYCTRCEVAICQICHQLYHRHHTCKDLSTVTEETKDVIKDSTKSIATMIKEREEAIKELTRCSDVITSSRDKVITHIREQKAFYLNAVSQWFDDMEKKADDVSDESQKIININLNSVMSDISSLKESNQIAQAASNYDRKAEIIESSKRVLKIIQSQKYSVIDLHHIKRSLHTIKYDVN